MVPAFTILTAGSAGLFLWCKPHLVLILLNSSSGIKLAVILSRLIKCLCLLDGQPDDRLHPPPHYTGLVPDEEDPLVPPQGHLSPGEWCIVCEHKGAVQFLNGTRRPGGTSCTW